MSNSRSTFDWASAARSLAPLLSIIIDSMACAIAKGSPGGTSRPNRPFSSTSRQAGTSLATMGIDAAIASIRAIPKPSSGVVENAKAIKPRRSWAPAIAQKGWFVALGFTTPKPTWTEPRMQQVFRPSYISRKMSHRRLPCGRARVVPGGILFRDPLYSKGLLWPGRGIFA